MDQYNNKYQHEIQTDVLIEAFTATDEKFKEKKEVYKKFGIERISIEELKKKHSTISFYGKSEHLSSYTYIKSAKIEPTDTTEKDFLIKDLNEKHLSNLFFDTCQVSDIKISDCKFSNPNDNNSIKPSINFFNSQVEDLCIEKSAIEELFIKDSTIGKIFTDESLIKKIEIDNTTTKDFRFWAASRIGESKIKNSTTNNFNISGAEMDKISIQNSSAGRFDISHSKVDGFYLERSNLISLSFLTSEVGNISCLSSSIRSISTTTPKGQVNYFGDLSFRSSEVKLLDIQARCGDLKLSGSTVDKCTLSESMFKEMSIGSGSDVNLFIDYCSINYLSIKKVNIKESTSISLSDTKIYSCAFEEMYNSGKIILRRVSALDTKEIRDNASKYDGYSKYWKHLKTLSGIRFRDEPYFLKSTFRINYSSLGSTEFIDCDLNSFESFEFNNSRLTEIFIHAGTMPMDILIYRAKESSKDWFEQKVSWFNQLTTVFQTHGDIYRSVDHRSASASFKHKLLKETKSSRKVCFDKLAFRANKMSSNYGADWSKAVWFIGWTSLLFYLLILFTTGNLFQKDTQFDPDFIGYYFYFLNPLKPIDFFEKIGTDVKWYTRIIDFLSRIIISYGIYQLVTAFRRYGRK